MGEVYRAWDTRLQREVALKVLPSELSSDAARLKRFETEARLASAFPEFNPHQAPQKKPRNSQCLSNDSSDVVAAY